MIVDRLFFEKKSVGHFLCHEKGEPNGTRKTEPDAGASAPVLRTKRHDRLHLTVNIYGDIMDDDTKKIIADGNVSHDIRRIYEFPTEWKDRKPSVVSALREKDAAVKEVKTAKSERQKTKNPER